ncbi:MAG: hypothetical protein HPY53_02665 [Brevinematales bacterium]|nr:hypothetical protein [Brevinematales bacterium]
MKKEGLSLSLFLFAGIILVSCAGPIETGSYPPVPVNSIKITVPAQNSSSQLSNIVVSGTVTLAEGSSIAQILLSVDSGVFGNVAPANNWTTNIIVTSEGIHYLVAALILSDGTTNLSSVVAFEYDCTKPGLNIDSPSAAGINPIKFTAIVQYNDSFSLKAGKVYMKLNSGSYIACNYYVAYGTPYFTNSFTGVTGSNTFYCYGVDDAGNYSATNIRGFYCSNVPAVTCITPTPADLYDGAFIGGLTVHLSGTVSIGAPAAISAVLINDGSITNTANISGGTWWFDFPLPQGSLISAAYTITAAGNNGTTNEIHQGLMIDTVTPVVTLDSHTNNQPVGEIASLNGQATDMIVGVDKIYIKIDGGGFQNATLIGNTWSFNAELTATGPHTILYYGADFVGNSSATNSISLVRTSGVHSVTLSSPFIVESGSLTVSGECHIDAPATLVSLTLFSDITTNQWTISPSANWSIDIPTATNGDDLYVMMITSDGKTNFSSLINYLHVPLVTPLTLNTLYEPLLICDNFAWYSFNAVAGVTYRVWWDDAYQGTGTYSGDTDASAWGASGIRYMYMADSGYLNINLITAQKTEKIYISFEPYHNAPPAQGQIGIKVIQQ